MSQIEDLANLMRVFQQEGRRFVLMLGAGASMSSGVPGTRTMMKQVLDTFGSGIKGRNLEERFDALMTNCPASTRRLYLKPYLTKTPSVGYERLADLIRAGFFEKVITFNFDTLLESVLQARGMPFTTVVNGEYENGKIPEAMKQPGVTILKLHGSLRGVGDFIFDGKGMVDYHAAIRQALGDLTAGDIMVCGYAYNDQCVISSFSKDGQGHVVVVDPEPSSDLCDVGKKRGSLLEFRDKDGYFDGFFQALSDALKGGQAKPSKAQQERPKNPFKFLEAYRREDAGAFFGRDARIDEVVDGLRRTGRAFFILGPANDGKTSMVRAGVIPRLQSDPAQATTAVLYLRCQPNLEAWLLSALERERRKAGRPPAGALDTALADLAAPQGGRSYLVLDQFERVVRPYEKSAKGQIEFNDLLARLVGVTPDTVTVVCIARHEGERMFPALLKLRLQDRVVMLDYDGAFVEQAIKAIAAQEHIEFEDAAVKKLRELYETTSEESRFTLAHVNAVCHLLCESGGRTLADLQPILDTHSGVLNRLINHFDVMGFMEDVPDQMAARSLLPRMMKLVFLEGRQDVAECLSCQLEELLSPASSEEESHAAAGR